MTENNTQRIPRCSLIQKKSAKNESKMPFSVYPVKMTKSENSVYLKKYCDITIISQIGIFEMCEILFLSRKK